jgi:hypothetical protein
MGMGCWGTGTVFQQRLPGPFLLTAALPGVSCSGLPLQSIFTNRAVWIDRLERSSRLVDRNRLRGIRSHKLEGWVYLNPIPQRQYAGGSSLP